MKYKTPKNEFELIYENEENFVIMITTDNDRIEIIPKTLFRFFVRSGHYEPI